MTISLPGWKDLQEVSRWEHLLRSVGWYLFAGGILAELIALFDKRVRRKRVIEIVGIWCFVLMLAAERAEYAYQDRWENLTSASATGSQLKADRLAQFQKPRLLNAHDRAVLADRLNGLGETSLKVFWVEGDGETEAFGKSIIEATKPKLLHVGGIVAEMDDPTSPIATGVSVEVLDLRHPGKLASVLFEFFQEKGMEPKLLECKDKRRMEDGWIVVRIRPRPTSLN